MSTLTKKCMILLSFLATLLAPSQDVRAGEIDLELVKGIEDNPSIFNDFTEEMGLAIAYLPMAPAEPLGLLGWDIGIEVSAVDIDQSVWRKAITDSPPGTVVIPRIHLQKGLPFGIDVGAVYTSIPSSNIKVIGGEVKWAVVSGNVAVPAIAIRGSYTTLTGVDDLDLETMGADISISKGFGPITPYAGYGQVWINAEAKGDFSNLGLKSEINTSKPFVGVKLSLALINIVAEADFGTTKTYTGRINIGF